MRVDPGELDQRIRIIRHYEGMQDGYPVEGIETVLRCWAKVSPEKGSEFTSNEREAGDENIRLLQRVSLCCAAAAGICVFGCFFYLPFLVAVAAAAFMALIVRIVRNVFQKAMEMKSELDLTV